jgi:hypothetical protein
MAGNITAKWQASTVTVTTTNLVSGCQNSSTLLSGWTSGGVTNSNNCFDFLYSGQFTLAAANAAVGTIALYVIASLNDTPTWPPDLSSGTWGTESATPVVFKESNQRDAVARLLWSATTSATNGRIYSMPQTGIAQLFGGAVPTNHCLWLTANANTGSASNFQATCAIYQEPLIAQYT